MKKNSKGAESAIAFDLTASPASQYEILKNIGVPAPSRNGRQTQYPFHLLGVNDGFRIDSKRAKNAGVSARHYASRHDVTIVVRKDPKHPGKHLVVRSA